MLKQLWCWLWHGHTKKLIRVIQVTGSFGDKYQTFDYMCTQCGYYGNTKVKPED